LLSSAFISFYMFLFAFSRHVVLCDPMLATGGSALTAIEAGPTKSSNNPKIPKV